jgi:hypothetical protein
VGEFIENNDIPRPAERGDGAHGGGVTTGEGEGGGCLLEFRDGAVEFFMRGKCAADEAGGSCPKSRALTLGHGGGFQCRMRRETEIVV